MSTLPDSAPFWKKFWIGQYGWSHALQEFAVYAISTSIAGWLISPLLVPVVVVVLVKFCGNRKCLPYIGEKYWRDREMDQTIAMGRPKGRLLMPADFEVPDKPNDVWTQDAIEDVTTPRKWRGKTALAALVYGGLQFLTVGWLGLLW